MTDLLALGVSIRWADAGSADFIPILAIAAAILVVRFAVGLRLTVLTVLLAVLGGTLWAASISRWGFSLPTLVAIGLVAAGALAVRPHPE
ncbi:MAG: hypothetical protein ACRDKA_05125 [Actinomycetota bacterium]